MLNPDYKEILQCFVAFEVRYLLIGAYAMAAHGYPRSTADIDLWVGHDPNNAALVYRALAAFGAPMGSLDDRTFSHPGVVFQVGVAPCRIDVLTSISGPIDFDQAESNAVQMPIDSVPVRVLSINDIIINKSASGRPKDMMDIRRLRRSS